MPKVYLRDLVMEDAADRYQWCLDKDKIWLRVEVDNEKAIKSYKRAG